MPKKINLVSKKIKKLELVPTKLKILSKKLKN